MTEDREAERRPSRRERLGFPADVAFLREGALVVVVVGVIETFLYRLYNVNWRVPLSYGGDGLSNDVYVKSMSENGWYLRTPRLAAPFAADWRDFPLGGENIHYLSEKILSIVSGSWITGVDLYFVVGFFLVALTTYFVARFLGFQIATALIVGVLYAFSPYHAFRGSGHLDRGVYYIVPVAVLLLVWTMNYRTEFFRTEDSTLRWRRGRIGFAIVVGLLLGGSDTQNAMFLASIMAGVVILAAMRDRDWRPLAVFALVGAATFGSLAVNNIPFALSRLERGPNKQAGERNLADQDVYALRTVRLILPAAGHRVALLAKLTNKAASGSLANGESSGTALGIVGSVGFLWSIGMALAIAGRRRGPTARFVGQLGVINLIAVLIGTIGGFAYLLAVAGVEQYRTWNRISTFIAFASLLATAVLFEWLFSAARRRARSAKVGLGIVAAVVAVVLVAGVLDQTPARYIPSYATTAKTFDRDADFYHSVERSLPRSSMVFQLPIAFFPEQGPIVNMPDYAEFVAYVQTTHLRWSYGAMRGRPESDWQQALLGTTPAYLLATVAAVGFNGLVLDTQGYADQGKAILQAAEPLLGDPKLRSADGNFVFLNLRPLRARLVQDLGKAAVAKSATIALKGYEKWTGFSFPEQSCTSHWHWATSKSAEVDVSNPTSAAETLTLSTSLLASPAAHSITVAGPGFSDVVPLTAGAGSWQHRVSLAPGTSHLSFTLSGPPYPAGADRRGLQFEVLNPSFAAAASPLTAWVAERQQGCTAG